MDSAKQTAAPGFHAPEGESKKKKKKKKKERRVKDKRIRAGGLKRLFFGFHRI